MTIQHTSPPSSSSRSSNAASATTVVTSALLDSHHPASPTRTKPIQRVNGENYRLFQEKFMGSMLTGKGGYQATSGHTTLSYSNLLEMNFQKAPWLLQGLMRANEVGMVYAQTGVGKTWLTLALAMVVAGGGKLLDWTNDTPKRVLYLDGEMDTSEMVGRMKQLQKGLKCDPDSLSKNLVLCARQMQTTITGNFIEIETEESQLGILQYAQEHKVDLIVIDNLTTLSGQLDENASKDMKLFNVFLLRAKQLGIAVIVVHHQGKGKDSGPRGSTAMVATLNLVLKLEASTQERAAGDKDARFTIVFEKNRGNVDSRPLPVRITNEAGNCFGDFKGVEDQADLSLIIDPDAESNIKRAKRLLETCKYKNQTALAAAFGISQSGMSKILANGMREGSLTKMEIDSYYHKASGILETEQF